MRCVESLVDYTGARFDGPDFTALVEVGDKQSPAGIQGAGGSRDDMPMAGWWAKGPGEASSRYV